MSKLEKNIEVQSLEDELRKWDGSYGSIQSKRNAVWHHEKIHPDDWWHIGQEKSLADIVSALKIKPKMQVLELGCGVGRLAVPLARDNPESTFIGVDVAPSMIDVANMEAKINKVTNVVFIRGDGRTIPVGADSVHAAYCMLLFNHTSRATIEGYLAELGRVLTYGSLLRFQFIRGEDASAPNRFVYSEESMTTYVEKHGFRVVRSEGSVISPVWGLMTCVNNKKPYIKKPRVRLHFM